MTLVLVVITAKIRIYTTSNLLGRPRIIELFIYSRRNHCDLLHEPVISEYDLHCLGQRLLDLPGHVAGERERGTQA